MIPWRAALLVSTMAATACAAAFEEPVQCKTDHDCDSFAQAVCDFDQGVCVRGAADIPPTPTPTPSPQTARDGGADAATDAQPLSPCANPAKPTQVLPADIAVDLALTCDTDYVLKGAVHVRAGATLRIAAGTTVKGDVATRGALFVMPGAKLVASGLPGLPVVFTSTQPADQRNPGDWGGVAILGSAPPTGALFGDRSHAWGGTDPSDASGSLRYVRIEYATTGLQLAGVGRGTTIDFVQVRKNGDDCFHWHGGTVNAKHLVCQYPGDEAFQFDEGYDGSVQFLVAQRTPLIGSDHNGLLVDAARVSLANATLCGAELPNQGYGVLVRNGGRLSAIDAIVSGYGAGVDVQGTAATPLTIAGSTFFGNHDQNLAYPESPTVTDPASPFYDDDFGFDEIAWLREATRRNTEEDPGLARCFDPGSPGLVPASPLTSGAVVPPSDGFFDTQAAYVGALGALDWTSGGWVAWGSR